MHMNPDEAPKGFVAEPSLYGLCLGCEFAANRRRCAAIRTSCNGKKRKDGCTVVFVKAPPPPKPDRDAAWLLEQICLDFPSSQRRIRAIAKRLNGGKLP